MRKQRKVTDEFGWAYRFVVGVVKPSFYGAMRLHYRGGEHLPERGGCIVVANHMSHIDPLVVGLFTYEHGRLIRYLAKQQIFETPVLKDIARNARQIPVARQTRDAASAFDAAVDAVNAGECVGFYPEGTLTRDPDLWPMTGKQGAARVALATGCPVIPVAHWGVQQVLYPYASKPDLFPRKDVTVTAGPSIDFADLRARMESNEPSGILLKEATERIMDTLTGLVADLRGEEPPAERFDPRKAGVRETGNPNKRRNRHPREER